MIFYRYIINNNVSSSFSEQVSGTMKEKQKKDACAHTQKRVCLREIDLNGKTEEDLCIVKEK